MSARQSPFSKMFLVSPAIYSKLLSCLDERDRAMAESLNPPESDVPHEERRPSEQILEQIQEEEMNPIDPPPPSQPSQPLPSQPSQPIITPQALQDALVDLPPAAQPANIPIIQAPPIPNYDIIMPSITHGRTKGLRGNKDPFRKKGKKGLSIVPFDENIPLSMLQRLRKDPTARPAPTMPIVPPQPQWHPPLQVPQDPTSIYFPQVQPNLPAEGMPTCVTTKRGQICGVGRTNVRTSKTGNRYVCEYCGISYSRNWDLKRHLLQKHDVEPEGSYRRWGIADPDQPQGVKRDLTKAGIKTSNPKKVSRVVRDPSQSGSGSFTQWK